LDFREAIGQIARYMKGLGRVIYSNPLLYMTREKINSEKTEGNDTRVKWAFGRTGIQRYFEETDSHTKH